MGEEALISHSKGDGHKRRVKDAVEVQSFFAKSGIKKSRAKMADGSVQSSTSTSASQSCDNSVSDANQSTSSASGEKDCSSKRKPKLQTTIDCNILSSKALEAEIIWTISSACKGYSNNSAKDLNLIFRAMFSDSHTAQEFELGADKLKYVTNWGVAPYFKDLLKAQLHTSDVMVISFDESLNESTQNCQVDIVLRFWGSRRGKGGCTLGCSTEGGTLINFWAFSAPDLIKTSPPPPPRLLIFNLRRN